MGGAYEVTGSAVKKYYSIAGQTVAMNDGSGLKYLLTDHLGSTSGVLDSNGSLLSQQRYLPFGEVRTDTNPPYITQTDLGYTGQRNLSGTGLMDYRARFYSSALGRFVQPDSIIPNPGNPQSLNRFGYVGNNPLLYNDPTGHIKCEFDKQGNDYCYENDRKTKIIKSPSGGGGGGPIIPVVPPGPASSGEGDKDEVVDILGLDNYSPLACGPGPSCDPAFMKCWHYELGYRTTQWFEIPCSDMRANSLDSYYLDYQGSYLPWVGLTVDAGGMITDGASVATFVFPGVGPALSAEFEFIYSGLEGSYTTYMIATGGYDIYDTYHTNLLDSEAARNADISEAVPVAGFLSSLVSAINNIQVISAGFELRPAYATTWNGLPPPIP
jgi:RHS repeat-associated protein